MASRLVRVLLKPPQHPPSPPSPYLRASPDLFRQQWPQGLGTCVPLALASRLPWVPEVSRSRRAGPKSRAAGDWWRGGAEARNLWEQMSLISLPCSDDWQLALRFSALNKFAGLDKFRGAVPNRSSVFFVHPLLRPRVYQAWNSKRMSSWACVLWFRCSSVLELSVRFVSSLLWLKKCSRLWCPLSSHELILYLTVVFSEYGVPWSRYSRSHIHHKITFIAYTYVL